MPRILSIFLQGEMGLIDGEIWWMDGRWMAIHCLESFASNQRFRSRVEVGSRLFDLQVKLRAPYDREISQIRRGYLHLARYALLDPTAQGHLVEELQRINPGVDVDAIRAQILGGAAPAAEPPPRPQPSSQSLLPELSLSSNPPPTLSHPLPTMSDAERDRRLERARSRRRQRDATDSRASRHLRELVKTARDARKTPPPRRRRERLAAPPPPRPAPPPPKPESNRVTRFNAPLERPRASEAPRRPAPRPVESAPLLRPDYSSNPTPSLLVRVQQPSVLAQVISLSGDSLRLKLASVPGVAQGAMIEVVLAIQTQHIYLPFMAEVSRREPRWMELQADPPADVRTTLRGLIARL